MALLKDYYKPLKTKEIDAVLRNEILKRNSQRKAVLVIVKENQVDHFGVEDKIVLQKSLDFYGKQKDVTGLYWFYTKELTETKL